MTMLKLPDELLDHEVYVQLPPQEKSAYIEKELERILDRNQDTGVRISDIVKATRFDRNPVSKYLEKLVSRRIAYKIVQGQTIVYHKNGRLIHHLFKKDLVLRDRNYSFKALYDGSEIVIFIQEKKNGPLGIIQEGGGILVPLKELDEFAKYVNQAKTEIPFIKSKLITEMIE